MKHKRRGEEAYVDGAVTKDGQDYGWYQIKYKGRKAYVSADFLTSNKPVATAASGSAPASSASSGSGSTPAANLVYCDFCGKWYEEGNVFRNHICPGRDAANAASSEYSVPEEELAYCEYCGQWYPVGNVFRNHICPGRDAANAE